MMISYKVTKANPLRTNCYKDEENLQMPSSHEGNIISQMLSSDKYKINSHTLSSNKEKRSSPMTKAYRDKVNHLILNDFKIYEGKAHMINCQEASERRCCSYD